MCLKTYTEAKARRAGSHLVTGCTGGCHFDNVRCGQGGRGLSPWWPYGLRFPDLVYILSFLFIVNITEMIGISLRIVLRCFHDLMFLLCWEIKNSWFLIPVINSQPMLTFNLTGVLIFVFCMQLFGGHNHLCVILPLLLDSIMPSKTALKHQKPLTFTNLEF